MIELKVDCSDEEVFEAVRIWVNILAEEDYQRAFDMVYIPHGSHWNIDLLKAVITGYGNPTPKDDSPSYKVTQTSSARVESVKPRWEIDRCEETPQTDGEVAEVVADLPLNGVWTDLTAVFELHKLGDHCVLELLRIDVL